MSERETISVRFTDGAGTVINYSLNVGIVCHSAGPLVGKVRRVDVAENDFNSMISSEPVQPLKARGPFFAPNAFGGLNVSGDLRVFSNFEALFRLADVMRHLSTGERCIEVRATPLALPLGSAAIARQSSSSADRNAGMAAESAAHAAERKKKRQRRSFNSIRTTMDTLAKVSRDALADVLESVDETDRRLFHLSTDVSSGAIVVTARHWIPGQAATEMRTVVAVENTKYQCLVCSKKGVALKPAPFAMTEEHIRSVKHKKNIQSFVEQHLMPLHNERATANAAAAAAAAAAAPAAAASAAASSSSSSAAASASTSVVDDFDLSSDDIDPFDNSNHFNSNDVNPNQFGNLTFY